MLWDEILEVFYPTPSASAGGNPSSKPVRRHQRDKQTQRHPSDMHKVLGEVDFVPPSLPMSSGKGQMLILEDNEAVIKMTIKGRSPNMRHVPRTHRVDLDWLFERVQHDKGIRMKYVNTKQQLADMLTKGSFTAQLWKNLCELCQIGPYIYTCLLYTSDAADE